MPRATPLPTEIRRRVQRALKTRDLRAALRSNTGAIDLASIMVGVIVIGVVAGVIAATVFAVIPWAQNAAAKQGLDAVRTAESVAMVQDGTYLPSAALIASGRIQSSANVAVAADTAGSCYVAVSKSAAGDVYMTTNLLPTATKVTSSTTSACIADAELSATVASVGAAIAVGPPVVTSLSAGYSHSDVLDASGQLWAWGGNSYGELGDGTKTSRPTPLAVADGHSFTAVSSGRNYTVAIDVDGILWAWGLNSSGQLGDGTTLDRTVPVPVAGNHKFSQVSAGQAHVVAVDDAGKLWSWGDDAWGQLGDNAPLVNKSLPTPVANSGKFIQVSAGTIHSTALDDTGKMWAWGRGGLGALGSGIWADAQTPVAVAGGHKFKHFSAAYEFTVALDETGKAWAWGYNYYNELNDGITVLRGASNTPLAVVGAKTFTQVTAGYQFVAALDTSGKLWGWGLGQYGALGNGAESAATGTVAVSGNHRFTQIAAGNQHVLALDETGKLWSWGLDSSGQLGNDASLTNMLNPVLVAPIG